METDTVTPPAQQLVIPGAEVPDDPEYQFHPLANIFPILPADELKALAEDIAKHGLSESITLAPDGRVLDGRNRLIACQMVGVKPTFETHYGDLLAFILSRNLHRRHLSTSQRSMGAAKLCRNSDMTQQQAADLFKVSRDSVIEALKVLDAGDPALVKSVETGERTVNAAGQEPVVIEKQEQKRRTRTHCLHGNYVATCDECCKHGLMKHICISCRDKTGSPGSKPPKSGTLVIVNSNELVAERDEVATAAHREDRKNLQRFMYLIVDLGFRTAAKRSADLKSLEEAKELMVTLVETWKPL